MTESISAPVTVLLGTRLQSTVQTSINPPDAPGRKRCSTMTFILDTDKHKG